MKGSSGARLTINKDTVVKSVPLSNINAYMHLKEQYAYMQYLSQFNLTPRILSAGYTKDEFYYEMEFIKQTSPQTKEQMLAFLEIFKENDFKYPVPDLPFSTYLDRLKQHIKYLSKFDIFRKMMTYKYFVVNDKEVKNIDFLKYFNIMECVFGSLEPTLCHGDLTVENTVNDKLIDTNFLMDCWNHFLIDYGKIAQSYHYNYNYSFSGKAKINIKDNVMTDDSIINSEEIFSEICFPMAVGFEVSHYLRMLKYKLAESEFKFKLAYIRMCQCYEEIKQW